MSSLRSVARTRAGHLTLFLVISTYAVVQFLASEAGFANKLEKTATINDKYEEDILTKWTINDGVRQRS